MNRRQHADGRILVIGATGAIGCEVFRRLAAAGEHPRALVRDPLAARTRLGDGAEHVVGDLDLPETVEAAMAGVDRVFLLTRQTAGQVAQERHVISAAANAGVSSVVKLSVFRADADSPLRIARQHRETERALEASGVPYTVVRPVFLMQNLFAMARKGAIRTAAGDGRVAMVDARDVAATAVAALTHIESKGRIYTLTGPRPMSFDEVARTIACETDLSVLHQRVAPDAVRQATEHGGAESWFGSDMATLHQMLAAGYEDLVTDDVRDATGTAPATLAEFAHDFADRLADGLHRASDRGVLAASARPARM